MQPAKIPRKTIQIADFSDEECYELYQHIQALRIADWDRNGNGTTRGSVFDPEHAFLFMLYPLHYPATLQSCQYKREREYSQLSGLFNTMIDYIYDRFFYLVINNIDYFIPRLVMYKLKVQN